MSAIIGSVDASVEQPADDPGRDLQPTYDPRLGLIAAAVCALSGLIILVLAEPLADLLAAVLPGRAQISSGGRGYPPFEEVAPSILRRTGAALLASAAIAAIGTRVRVEIPRRVAVALVAAVVASTGVVYLWLSEPHNGFSSNARYHWVDYLTFDDDNFFYAAGRLPHMVFYEVPFVWQGINASIVAWLCYLIGRRLGMSIGRSTALATLPLFSTNLLMFYSAAEDVLLNTAILLFLIYAWLRGSSILIGVGLSLAVLGRPAFIVFLPCAYAAEALAAIRDRRWIRWVGWTRLAVLTGSFAVVTLGVQILFTVLGDRYLLVDGKIIDLGPLAGPALLSVEGFTISAFSGVYLGHFVWITPIVLFLASAATLISARSLSPIAERTAYFCATAVLAHLFVHESHPIGLYGIRYLTYAIPFLVVLAWTLLAARPRLARERENSLARSPWLASGGLLIAAALTLGVAALPTDPVGEKRATERRSELELADVRHQLRDLAEGRAVYFRNTAKSSRNYISWVLKTNRGDVERLDEPPLPGSLVIERRENGTPVEPELETPNYVVYIVPDA